jgi:hypothetical protein
MNVPSRRFASGNEYEESTVRSDLRILSLGILLAVGAGCESTRWNWLKPPTPAQEPPVRAAAGGGNGPDSTALVRYLNDNAGRVRSLKIDDMSIDISIENQSFGVMGRILAESPRNFRMKATALGKDEVDLGSNGQEFWFWAARNPEPHRHQFFCSYKDLTEGRVKMMPLPIQPEWVMETLGLGPYGPADKYQLDTSDRRTLRLIERTRSPQGQPVRKVIVMNRDPVKVPTPQVTDYQLIDETSGHEVCSAHISMTKLDHVTGAVLPYKMELRVPAQKMKMVLKMDGMSINAPISAIAFQRQPIQGFEPFNLATGRPEPSEVQPTQGFTPPRR